MGKPAGRSLSDFQLNIAEEKLLEACRNGGEAIISEGLNGRIPGENTVRADFLRFLALGGDENAPVHEQGVLLRGAYIEGGLNLENIVVPHSLGMFNCQLDSVPDISGCNISGNLIFQDCRINGLNADNMICSANVLLNNSTISGIVRLQGANIGGNFECTDSKFNVNEDEALILDGARIKGSVFLNKKFSATGVVRLVSTHIDGSLECSGATFKNDLLGQSAVIGGHANLANNFSITGSVNLSGAQIGRDLSCSDSKFEGKNALYLSGSHIGGNVICEKTMFLSKDGYAIGCQRALIKGSVYLGNGFAVGNVTLFGTQIGGVLDCSNTTFKSNHSSDRALACERAVITGDVRLENTTVKGVVSLSGSQIGGNLSCENSQLHGNGEYSLLCENAVITGTVYLNKGFSAIDTVRLCSSEIGSLDCCQAKFQAGYSSNQEKIALLCNEIIVKRSVFLRNGSAIGAVHFTGAKIGGNFECQKGNFNGDGADALKCDGAVIKGGVFFTDNFVAIGMVSLARVTVGVDLCCSGVFYSANEYAFNAEGMSVASMFYFQTSKVIKGTVSLATAKVATLADNLDSWPTGKLILDGFVYDKLIGGKASTDAKSRIDWLKKQIPSHLGLDGDGKQFKPHPWQQLQKTLRETGHFEDARQVGIAFEQQRRKANVIGQAPEDWYKLKARIYRHNSRLFHRMYGWLIGYGYRPFRLFFIMIGVWLFCGLIYWGWAVYGHNGHGVFAPSNPLVFQNPEYNACKFDKDDPSPVKGAGNWYLCEALRAEYTGFSPFAYSLDLILPLVDLQQEHDWAPIIPTPTETSAFWTWTPHHEYLIRFLVWFEILFGWIASLLLVAVVSGLTKRGEE